MKIIAITLILTTLSNFLAQTDSNLKSIEKDLFSTSSYEKGKFLNFYIADYTQGRVSYFNGFAQKIERFPDGFRISFVYGDDAWHNDAFVYDVNTASLSSSKYLFYNKDLDTTIGHYTESSSYVVKAVDETTMKFIDTMSIKWNDSTYMIYKFKTTHSVKDSNDICMLHFISPQIGLISRQSNIWWCCMASYVPKEYNKGFCAFEDRNHFSLLNISNQFIKVKKFGKEVTVEKPNWIIRALRTGNPVDSTILNFYNDTIECGCSYNTLFKGYFDYLSKTEPYKGKTRKQIILTGIGDIIEYNRNERQERKRKVNGTV